MVVCISSVLSVDMNSVVAAINHLKRERGRQIYLSIIVIFAQLRYTVAFVVLSAILSLISVNMVAQIET